MIFNKMIFLHYDGPDYLCFTSPNLFSVGMSKTGSPTIPSLEYSKDKSAWTEFIAGTTIVSVEANEKVYFRGNNSFINNNASSYWCFVLDGTNISASGNIMSLLDNACESTTISADRCFYQIFLNCTSLIAAPALPATTLSTGCYWTMFSGCTSLITAPTLPATTLSASCYRGMFSGCTSLTTAPSLPATTLTYSCYLSMFSGCESLTTVPALPATTLLDGCYNNMFRNCTSLKVYSSSGVGYDKEWKIPSSGSVSEFITHDYMFRGTIGDYSESGTVTINRTFYTQNEPV